MTTKVYESVTPIMSSFLFLFEIENNGDHTSLLKMKIPIPSNKSSAYFLNKSTAKNHFKCWSNDSFADLDKINNFSIDIQKNDLNSEFMACTIKWNNKIEFAEDSKLTCLFSPNIDANIRDLQTDQSKTQIEKLLLRKGSIVVSNGNSNRKTIRMRNRSNETNNNSDRYKYVLFFFGFINMLIVLRFIIRRPLYV